MSINSELVDTLSKPTGAASFVKRKLDKDGLKPSVAARQIGVDPSTMSRFLNGSDLSISLAAKLSHHFNFDVETLFNLEAQKKAHAARELIIVK